MNFPRIPTATNNVTQQPGASQIQPPKELIIETREIIKSADNGNAYHQNLVGKMYRDGVDVEQCNEKAVLYFMKAEEGQNPEATTNLNAMFLDGRGINPDSMSRAINYLTNTANEKLDDAPKAHYQLGLLYADTQPQKAISLFKHAVKGNVPGALNQLVNLLYRLGILDAKNAPYFKKAAEELKHAQSAFAYAEILHSQGSRADSLPYYKMAADQGHQLAEFRHLEHSDAWYETKSEFSFEKMDIRNLNFGVTSNKKEVSENAFKLGKAYLHGDKESGVLPNAAKAMRFLTAAAELGHGLSGYLVSGLLKQELMSTGSDRSTNHLAGTILKYFNIAFNAGYLPAVLEVRAARNKEMDAAFDLYEMLSTGNEYLELPIDIVKAKYYLNMAIEGGYKPALEVFIKDIPKNSAAHVECLRQINATPDKKVMHKNLTSQQKNLAEKLINKSFAETSLNPEDNKYNVTKKVIPTSTTSTTSTTSANAQSVPEKMSKDRL